MRWKLIVFVFLIVLIGIAWYTAGKFRDAIERKQPSTIALRNVYLITSTGLPAGHLSSYLYQPIQTTFLDYLAYDGVRFTNAFSTSTSSLPAHLSILTGLYPFREELKTYQTAGLGQDPGAAPVLAKSLPAWLKTFGYKSAVVSADPELRDFLFTGGMFQETLAGSQDMEAGQPSYSSEQILQLASSWINKNRKNKHFLWVNFNEPQPPFDPPLPFKNHYAAHPFDGEIAAIDSFTGKLIHQLERANLYENSIVIFTSPFGESPSGSGRAGSVQDQHLQIPLLISARGLLPRQQMYQSMVSLADLLPTVAALMEKKLPFRTDGVALFTKGTSDEIQREFIFGQSWNNDAPVYFARTNRWKLVIGTEEILFSNSDRVVTNKTTESEAILKKLHDQLMAKGISQQRSM